MKKIGPYDENSSWSGMFWTMIKTWTLMKIYHNVGNPSLWWKNITMRNINNYDEYVSL